MSSVDNLMRLLDDLNKTIDQQVYRDRVYSISGHLQISPNSTWRGEYVSRDAAPLTRYKDVKPVKKSLVAKLAKRILK